MSFNRCLPHSTAHNKCNLKSRKANFIPVFFHNLFGFDAHLFIKDFADSSGSLTCIPNIEEKCISFTKKVKLEKCKIDGKTISI